MAHPKLHRLQTAQGTFLPSTHSTTAPFAAVVAWRTRSHCVHRPHRALSSHLPLPQRHHFPRLAAVVVRARVSNSQFTTNGKYCNSHYSQDIDSQLYHDTTRAFRTLRNIRKTPVVFPTTYKSRTYRNTPLLHLPLYPQSPDLSHLPKVGDIRSCRNGSELRETLPSW